jgi:hypothetical protein
MRVLGTCVLAVIAGLYVTADGPASYRLVKVQLGCVLVRGDDAALTAQDLRACTDTLYLSQCRRSTPLLWQLAQEFYPEVQHPFKMSWLQPGAAWCL